MSFLEMFIEELEHVLRYLFYSLLMAARYGLIALVITMAVGKGCTSFPLIKKKEKANVTNARSIGVLSDGTPYVPRD